MRQWIQDNVEHPVRWGIILLLHFSLAIVLGVEYGWILGLLYAFVLPVFLLVIFIVTWVGSLGVAVAVSAVVLPFYAIPCAIGLPLEWIWGLFLRARERRKRRKQARAICQRCGLRSDALAVEEALALSEEDIQTISWAVYKSNQATAERIAHVLADPVVRQLLPGIPEHLQSCLTTDATSLQDALLRVLKQQVRKQGFQTVVSIYHVRTMVDAENFLTLTNDDYVDILNDFAKYGRIAAEATAAKRVLAHRGLSLDV